MNIVYLDAFTVGLGKEGFARFHDLGKFTEYDRTADHEVVERAKDAEILLTNKVKITRAVIEQLPKLKYIGVTATGFNIVDTQAANELNIVVTNVKNYGSGAVAQHVFAMILAFSNRLAEHSNASKWAKSSDFCYFDFPLFELRNKTIGLVGFGDIGKKVAQIAQAFEMRVVVAKKTPFIEVPMGIEELSLDQLLEQSDVLSLHCPLTAENEGFMNLNTFRKMKASALLINTARGGLVNEADLAFALNKGLIAGAYLDVLSVEPPLALNPVLGIKNCKISPHIAWATVEARQKLMDIVYENICSFLEGKAVNVVN
jgi:glycerate dehydrogenase